MDDADLAQRRSDAALDRALDRRTAAERAEDPDTLDCGRHARVPATEGA